MTLSAMFSDAPQSHKGDGNFCASSVIVIPPCQVRPAMIPSLRYVLLVIPACSTIPQAELLNMPAA